MKTICNANSNISIALVDSLPKGTTVECVTVFLRENNIHHMKLQSSPFQMMKSGRKTIELRLYDEKRQKIKVGDQIIFTDCATGETLRRTVVNLHRFADFDALYHSLPLLQCGYTAENIAQASPADMEEYYTLDEQKKYGVVGIALC